MSQDRELAKTNARNLTAMQARNKGLEYYLRAEPLSLVNKVYNRA